MPPTRTATFMAALLYAAPVMAASDDVEEVYIARSVRDTRVAPTPFCETLPKKRPSQPVFEDTYTFKAVATRADDGRIVESSAKTVGSIHACFGTTEMPDLVAFSGDVLLGGAQMKGAGECQVVRADVPEKGITTYRCFLDLTAAAGKYAGGLLTTNTIFSRNLLGDRSNPPGYTQHSIATIRLWKRR